MLLRSHTCASCAHAHAAMLPRASPLTRVCPRALCLVWSAGHSCWTRTSSPPSQRRSSTDSRTLSKERGRETRHARQHASLPSLLDAGDTYLRLVRARAGRYVATRIPTDAREPPRPLSCVVRRRLTLSNNLLTCVPLTQTRITAISRHEGDLYGYTGPRVTCVVSCLSSCVLACACPRDLSLVCRADNFFWTTTNSPPQRVVTPPRKEGLTPLTLPVCHRCTARQETLVRGVVALRLARPVHQVSLPLAHESAHNTCMIHAC